jgi:hypothetical protein
MPKTPDKPKRDLDERVSIPLPPKEAIRALMEVDPDCEPSTYSRQELRDRARQGDDLAAWAVKTGEAMESEPVESENSPQDE